MKLFDLGTGFIAAVLVLLGTTQGVNTPQVEEEQVVAKTEVTTQLYVFNNSTSTGANSASNWIPTAPEDAPNCGPLGDVPCQIELDLTEYADMADYLATNNFPTDADVVNGPDIQSKR